jgi:hypothetical protein
VVFPHLPSAGEGADQDGKLGSSRAPVVDRYVTALPQARRRGSTSSMRERSKYRGEALDLPLIHTALEVVLTALEGGEERRFHGEPLVPSSSSDPDVRTSL